MRELSLFSGAGGEPAKPGETITREKPKNKRERQERIKKLWQANELTIPQMAVAAFCSEATVKRDLDEMSLSKKLK